MSGIETGVKAKWRRRKNRYWRKQMTASSADWHLAAAAIENHRRQKANISAASKRNESNIVAARYRKRRTKGKKGISSIWRHVRKSISRKQRKMTKNLKIYR